MSKPIPPLSGAQVRRFWSRTTRVGECLLWLPPCGRLDPQSYGSFCIGHRTHYFAHRVAWTLVNGPLGDGDGVLHRCDTPACVEPAHLFIGDQHTNMHDAIGKGRWSPKVDYDKQIRGEEHHRHKLTEDQVREIRRRRVAGEKMPRLAREFCVSYSAVQALCARRTWRHVA